MTKNRTWRRRATFIRPPLLGEHPPIALGCMLAVLVMSAITVSAILCGLIVAGWRPW